MPVSKTRSYGQKRRYNRAKKKTAMARRTRMYRQPMTVGIETCKMVKLTYAVQIRLDPLNGGSDQITFRANSLFDPEYATGGHQPLYFDQYSELYANYKVLGAKINVTGANDYSDQANVMGNLITINVRNEPQSAGSYTEAIEAKGAVYKQCQERRPFHLSHKYSAKKFHCITNIKDAVQLEGLTGGTGTGSNPPQEAYFNIAAYPLYALQNPYPACLNVRIDYIALFFNIKRMQGS